MRERTVPPLPKNQFGNLYLIAYAQSVAGHEGVGLPCIVNCLSNSVKRATENCGVVLLLEKEGQKLVSQELCEMIKICDQGAEFVEAKVDVQLDDLLSQRKNLKIELLNDLLPCPLGAVDEYTDPLLAVQVIVFSCGGFAIAVEGRISSIRGRAKFDNSSKILPTKEQSVFGIIGKAIIDVHVANPENPKGFAVIQSVNMRERTVPPLPENQFGNLYLVASAQSVAGHEGVELPCIVNCFSNSVKRATENCGVVLSLEKEAGQELVSRELCEMLISLSSPDIYFASTLSSWCKFPLYEADFGSGKPLWVSCANIPMKNTVVLVDEKSGGGIEAWVSLNESDMQKFIKHSEITDIMDCN
ncbi:hypothetical protein POM88_034202 [Heracleum sosnowskyi]|uniref:Uncharacterized protein n=1 Tax=Heracleum sosnowskyi TaxID=360622 RepID=A0AAD8HL78_9APIA|nr:hypothetical protein POM88_034202 [Heracleum sosnowskyi]